MSAFAIVSLILEPQFVVYNHYLAKLYANALFNKTLNNSINCFSCPYSVALHDDVEPSASLQLVSEPPVSSAIRVCRFLLLETPL